MFRQDFVLIEDESIDQKKPTEKSFKPVTSLYATTKYELPDIIRINAVYVNKKNIMQENKGQGYCYIIPEGLIQEIAVWLTRSEKGQESKVTLKTQAFFGDCIYEDGHRQE